MVKPNNPYDRPINATKDTATTIGELYGTRATDKKLNHAAGDRNVSPAAKYQAVGNAYESPKATKPKSKAKPKEETAVTAEDLFG